MKITPYTTNHLPANLKMPGATVWPSSASRVFQTINQKQKTPAKNK